MFLGVRISRRVAATAAVVPMALACLLGVPDSARADAASECDALGAVNLVHNCGFETHALTDWTVTNNVSATGPSNSAAAAHSGTDNLAMCEINDSTVSQQIDGTVPQAIYEASFYLANPYPDGAREDFSAEIDNTYDGDRTIVTDTTPNDQFDYVREVYAFRAGAIAPTLKFTAANPDACWYIDDVVVVRIDTPSQCDAVPTNLVQNCGFEADDPYAVVPTSWDLTPARAPNSDAATDQSGLSAHSGAHFYAFGATADTGLPADDDTLTQEIAGTTAGTTYTLSFSLQNLFPSSADESNQGPDFSAAITGTANGTVSVVSGHHPTGFDYTLFTASFLAGPEAPTIMFSGAKATGFFELDDVVVVPASACELAAGNLVQNCGFETGDLTGWTFRPGSAPTAYVDGSGDGANTGVDYFSFGSTTDDDAIAQTLTGYTPGASYDVSFWVGNNNPTAEPGFQATVEDAASGPVTLLDLPNPTGAPYTEYTATFTAGSGKAPTIVFAGRHNSGWMDLDDIVVTAAAPPATFVSVDSSQNPSVSGGAVTFTATVSPAPDCGTVSWQVDGVAPPAGTASGGSGATFTLGPIATLGVGTHTVKAVYSGCATAGASDGSVIQNVEQAGSPPPPPPPSASPTVSPSASPTVSPTTTPTASSTVVAPSITASVSGRYGEHHGWYRAPVTISFRCVPGSAALASDCPRPVHFSEDKRGGSVTAKVAGADGGVGSVTVGPIRIDLDPPHLVQVRPRKGVCTATDHLSGLRTCVVHKRRREGVVHWVAIATDVAGNVAEVRGRY